MIENLGEWTKGAGGVKILSGGHINFSEAIRRRKFLL